MKSNNPNPTTEVKARKEGKGGLKALKMNEMVQTFANAWKIPDLRKKILFTLMIVLLYRIGANLYVPFVNVAMIESQAYLSQLTSGIFGMVNLFSGGAFEQASLFALSVSPYITASIVMQLLTIAIPALERLSKEGDEGKKKINSITRIVTVALALITAYGYVKLLGSYGMLTISKTKDAAMYYLGMFVMVLCFCAGASIIMWMAERINQHGIGNGISIILFANIISRGGAMLTSMIGMMQNGMGEWLTGWKLALGIFEFVLSLVLAVVAVGLIVWFTNSEERIRIQYAKKVVGRKMYGGQSSNLPLKMNMAGVMPIIFANSIIMLPATLALIIPTDGRPGWATFVNFFSQSGPMFPILTFVLIVAFSYFYVLISFDPIEVSNNIKDNGGAVPGIRPGKPTADYIKKVLNRITAIGSIFLCFVACFPTVISIIAGYFMPESTNYFSAATIELIANFAFGGTSILIVIGVVLETFHQLEAEMTMRNYKGFLD